MVDLPPVHVRDYDDGPPWPTELKPEVEQAYRQAFYVAVREASRLSYEELRSAISAAWNDRRRTRQSFEVHVPTYLRDNLPDRPDLDGDQNAPDKCRRFLLIRTSCQAILKHQDTPCWAVQKSGSTTHLEMLHVSVGIRIYPRTPLARLAVDEGLISANDDLLRPRFYIRPGLDGFIREEVARRYGPEATGRPIARRQPH